MADPHSPPMPSSNSTAVQPGRGWATLTPRILLVAACLFFFLQELPYFQTRWIEDENSYSDAAWTFAHDGRIHMSMYPPIDVGSIVDVRPPAMFVALGGTLRLLGLGIWQARSLSMFGAIAAIIVTYLFGAYVAGELAGAIAALLVATDSILFVAGRTVRPEGVEAFLNTLTALLFVVAIRRNSWWIAAAAGLAAGLSMNFHINGAIAPLAMALVALYEYGPKIWRKSVPWAFAVTVTLCILPYVLWVSSDALHRKAYADMQSLGTEMPYTRLQGEIMRYSDFLGMSNLKVSVPIPIPVRAPIVLIILGMLTVLFYRNRRLFWYLALMLAAHMGWWYYLANKNVRYIAVAAPLFAVIVASGVLAVATTARLRQLAVALCAIYAVIGVAGNVFVVYRFRDADYNALGEQLRRAIPKDAVAYGANTFWLALHDRRYYSWDRSPVDYTMANLKPRYIIMNDRIMMHGSGIGVDNFGDVRVQATAVVKARGDKVAEIPSGFYGDLEVYRLKDAPGAQ